MTLEELKALNRCKTYNGFQRANCKHCGHPPCYFSYRGERLPYQTEDMAHRRVTLFTDQPPSCRDKNNQGRRIDPNLLSDKN